MIAGIRPYWRDYIGGEWRDGATGERITVTDPATGLPIAEVARAVAADVNHAVAVARRCFERRILRDVHPHRRGDLILEVARRLDEMADQIAVLECRDNGKTLAAGYAEVALTQRYLTYYAGLADKLEGRQIPLATAYWITRPTSPSACPRRSCPGTVRSRSGRVRSPARSSRATRWC